MQSTRISVIIPAALVAAIAPAWSQQAPPAPLPPPPHVAYAYPAGASRGASIDVRVGGQYLATASGVYVSGDGVQAKFVEVLKIPTDPQIKDLPLKLDAARKKLVEKGVAIPDRPPLLNDLLVPDVAPAMGVSVTQLRSFIDYVAAYRDWRRQPNAQLSESITLHLNVDAQATPGIRELRVITAAGLSNPVRFEVGQYSEIVAHQPNDGQPNTIAKLPAVLNGQILPGEVMRYSFKGRKGMQFVAAVSAESLVPYLADTVPGWFQSTLTLLDPDGNELATADHFLFRVDPIIHCVLPSNGDYTLEMRDSLYRGREDFVYRIELGELPVVTSVFPLGGAASGKTSVMLQGWNLHAKQQVVDGAKLGEGMHSVLPEPSSCNVYQFSVDALPEQIYKQQKSKQMAPKPIALPLVINGCILQPGETHNYPFTGKAGQKLVAEVMARRLGSQLDSTLTLSDSAGKQIAFNDDFEDKSFGTLTHQADSRIITTLPAAGVYTLSITDTGGKGGEEYGYRLRIGEPRPDYELRIYPSSVNLRAGATASVTVLAVRRDGYVGEIKLSLDGAANGFVMTGGVIPASGESTTVTLTAPANPLAGPVALHFTGSAKIGDKVVTHPAIPADDMVQAFSYRHLVTTSELAMDVLPK